MDTIPVTGGPKPFCDVNPADLSEQAHGSFMQVLRNLEARIPLEPEALLFR